VILRQKITCPLITCEYRTKVTGLCSFALADAGPMTLGQIGDHEGITRERVRQIEYVAIKKLKRLIKLSRIEFERPTEYAETTWDRLEAES
jgi:hypothetical protein